MLKKIKNTKKLFTPLVLATVLLIGASVPVVVKADFEQQIRELNADSAQKQRDKALLGVEASSLSDTISKLQAQISVLEGQIRTNQAKSAELQAKIAEAEAELGRQRKILGETIKDIYFEGRVTTLELLATSKDLSEFVDKQEYRNIIQEKIKDTLEKITALKFELKSQKEQVETLLKDQQVTQAQLDAQRAENNRLLGLNQSQQNELDQQIKSNSNKAAELRRLQILENIRLAGGRIPQGVPGGGGYPWGDARCVHPGYSDTNCPNYDWGYPGYGVYDQWGYGYRNCTSWTAWRVAQSGRYMPAGLGDAKNWIYSAANRGYSVDRTPREGDAAVNPNGFYGHVMYVEAILGDGRILISQYNGAGDGYYTSYPISPNGLYFVHL